VPSGQEVQILVIEVKEDSGTGGGNSWMQLASSYANLMALPANQPQVSQNCFPALGLEVVGNQLRVFALFTTDRVNCQPLTPMLHFSDLRWSVPGAL